jgi:hypothetical protein
VNNYKDEATGREENGGNLIREEHSEGKPLKAKSPKFYNFRLFSSGDRT